jgi:hypothetical protein
MKNERNKTRGEGNCVVIVDMRALGSPRGYLEDETPTVEWRLRTAAFMTTGCIT